MTNMGESDNVDDRTMDEVIAGLRALCDNIDTGRLGATATERAYLAGAVDALVAVSEHAAGALDVLIQRCAEVSNVPSRETSMRNKEDDHNG